MSEKGSLQIIYDLLRDMDHKIDNIEKNLKILKWIQNELEMKNNG